MKDLCKLLGRGYLVFRMHDTYKYSNGQTEMCTLTLAIGLLSEIMNMPTETRYMWVYRVK